MRLFVGLGNPGKKFENTRHNVGFMVLDALASRLSNFKFKISNENKTSDFKLEKKFKSQVISYPSLTLAKPQTMMNDSGQAVSSLASYYKILTEDIFVIHDDLDLKLGTFKIQIAKGPKNHKGLKSIDKALGTRQYWHVRVGIDNRAQSKISGEDYVLQEFTPKEKEILAPVLLMIVTSLVKMLH